MIQNINRIGIFSSLTAIEIKELLNYASYEEYKPNQMIFNENDTGSSLYIVISGKVKIFRVLSDNTIHEISNFCDNEVFGEMSFMDNHVRSANAEALCETSLVKITVDNYQQFSKAFPDAAFRFHKNLITEIQHRLRKTNDRYSYHIIWGKTMKTALAKNYEELLQSNIELSASRNFLYNVINSSSDIIFVVNDKFDVILFNAGAEKTLKYRQADFINKPAAGIFYEKEEFEKLIGALKTQKSLGDFETNFKSSENRKIIVNLSAFMLSPVDDAPGFGDGLVIVARDITQKKMLENQLMQNEKMIFLGRAVSEIVHDIKNPLTIIQLTKDAVQIKLEGASGLSAEVKKKFEFDFAKIDESVDRVQQIISNTLEYSKVVPGKKSRLDLKEVAVKSIEMAKINLKNNDSISVSLSAVASGPVLIDGNFQQLEQVVVNLITNAIQAIGKKAGGRIEVALDISDGSARLSVKDNGCGISEENMQYIFEPFFSTQQSDKGTGLGLSICQAIVSQHKGEIAVISKPGEGSEFILKIPVAAG
jgi:PAS domain S-box-containing protein